MTIDEAIKHCLEVAVKLEKKANIYEIKNTYLPDSQKPVDCLSCAADHRQLAAWLTDYKELKTKYSDVQEKIREIRGYLEFAEEHMNVMGVLEALDIIKDMR